MDFSSFITIGLTLFLFTGFLIADEETYHDWAVEIRGGEKVAEKIASKKDFIYLGPVGNLENIYHFQKKIKRSRRTKRSVELHTEMLTSHQDVRWVQPQTNLKRSKRNKIENYQDRRRVIEMFNDPKWPQQWYIYDTRSDEESKKFDMQIVPVWNMNITGRGVKLTIIDDGIEYTNNDLKDNYDPLCSTDLNDNDSDPMPNTAPGTSNEHGTRCASEIAMSANNNFCGVGVAFNSRVGGIRILDGNVNDVMEAKALGFNNNYIDIYSASWGPTDNGKTMEQPGYLTNQAFARGTQLGRNGKGSIYVWATGNGGYYEDSCSCDGYASSIHVISVSSISPKNGSPGFTEKCPSTMCVTYSTSLNEDSKLIVADIHGECINNHSGTSASAPYAAGIFALALEMNPNLTWRDVKHLIAWTSQIAFMKSARGWKRNGSGFWVNSRFGFGLLNAYQMVRLAKSWKRVPEFYVCNITAQIGDGQLSNNKSQTIILNGTQCYNMVFIENVIVKVNITYSQRGALFITLKSPHGMNTTLLPLRSYDNDKGGLKNWPLNSVHNWGENSKGNWTVFIEDKRNDEEYRNGKLENLQIEFYGMTELPHHVKVARNGRRKYDGDFEENKRNKTK